MSKKKKKETSTKTAVEILEARIASLNKKLNDTVSVTLATKERYEELIGLIEELEANKATTKEVFPIKERIQVLLEENRKAAEEATALAERISELRDMLDLLHPAEEN